MIKVQRLHDKSQTGKSMYKMVDRFSSDLGQFTLNGVKMNRVPISTMFTFVKNLPYKKDSKGVEIITRPVHLLTSPFKGYDCKKKMVLMGSYLRQQGIPFEFVAVSSSSDPVHHVLIRAKIKDKLVQIDPTYRKNRLYENRKWAHAEALSGISAGSAPVLVELYGEGNSIKSLANEFFNYRQNQLHDPETLGVVWTAGAITTLVGAILTAVTGITLGIIGIVRSRREDERAAKSEKEKREFDLVMYEKDAAAEAAAAADEAAKFKKYGLAAAGILLTVVFLSR